VTQGGAADGTMDATDGAPEPPLQPVEVAPPEAGALLTGPECPTADNKVQLTLLSPHPSACHVAVGSQLWSSLDIVVVDRGGNHSEPGCVCICA